MTRQEEVQQKLMSVPEQEWIDIEIACKKAIWNRTKGKTQTGAHSLVNLGMDALLYYFQEAAARLYEGRRDWKFERFSLKEQMIRIVGDIIGEEVKKYKKQRIRQEDKQEAVIETSDLSSFEYQLLGDSIDELSPEEKELIYMRIKS